MIGLDINTTRVQQLRDVVDVAQEVSSEELAEVSLLSFTTELEDLRECSVFIIIVPTPIDEFKAPDLTPLIKASEPVAQVLKAGNKLNFLPSKPGLDRFGDFHRQCT